MSGITEGMASGRCCSTDERSECSDTGPAWQDPVLMGQLELLNLLGTVGHSKGCPMSPPQHPCKSWLLINSITEGGGMLCTLEAAQAGTGLPQLQQDFSWASCHWTLHQM